MRTGAELTFIGPTPEMAVASAYASEVRDGSTWEYESRYLPLVSHGRFSVSLGDWAALKR